MSWVDKNGVRRFSFDVVVPGDGPNRGKRGKIKATVERCLKEEGLRFRWCQELGRYSVFSGYLPMDYIESLLDTIHGALLSQFGHGESSPGGDPNDRDLTFEFDFLIDD